MRTCTFTGHRPKFFPWGGDIGDPRAVRLLSVLRNEIRSALEDGFDTFICGGAQGVDTWAADIILSMKKQYRDIRLIIALPFEGYNTDVTDNVYLRILECADEVKITGTERGIAGFTKRDHHMIDQSERVIVVYDERSGIRSGTYRAVKYAELKGKELREIPWMDFLQEYATEN